jgi:hypothetical protein
MNIKTIFDLNYDLSKENQLTKNQWQEIIDYSFRNDKRFAQNVEYFYTEYLGFDINDCEDLITDIEQGDGDAFERFLDNIMYYFEHV